MTYLHITPTQYLKTTLLRSYFYTTSHYTVQYCTVLHSFFHLPSELNYIVFQSLHLFLDPRLAPCCPSIPRPPSIRVIVSYSSNMLIVLLHSDHLYRPFNFSFSLFLSLSVCVCVCVCVAGGTHHWARTAALQGNTPPTRR
jgi:hypothetical protein